MAKTRILIPMALALMLASSTAHAYTFDAMCAPESDRAVGADAPNLYFMLDRSGSMGDPSTDPSLTRWEAATIAIDEVVNDITVDGACSMVGDPNCDPLRFGLGFFSSGATNAVDVQEDAHINPTPTIKDAMDGTGPGGYTEIGAAAEVIRDASFLMDTNRSNIAVMISDGGPTSDGNCFSTTAPIDETIRGVQAICTARTRGSNAVQTYSVGFGTDSSASTNSLFAAAGGTGTCCLASDCAGQPRDPCSMSETELRSHLSTEQPSVCRQAVLLNSLQCTGSIEATSPSDLKNALLDIASAAACTFPLEIPATYPFVGAQPDPQATRVNIVHTFSAAFMPPGEISLPNVGDPSAPTSPLATELENIWGVPPGIAANYDNEGWYFSDANRQFVTLTPQLCADISAGDLTRVKTQVACACVKSGPCTAVDLGGFTPTQLSNMRCGIGTWQCIMGEDVCVAAGEPYPEICNGLDDDCDGEIDNIFESWNKPENMTFMIPADHAGIACQMRTTCTCDNGWQDPIAGNTWDEMLDAWTGTCQCGEGLEAPAETPAVDVAPPAAESSDQACSSTANAPQPVPWLMLLGSLGFVGLINRRRR